MKAGTCVICKGDLELQEDNNISIQFCPVCRRTYWPIKEELQQRAKESEDYDLETVSDSASSPILLCDDSDLRAFPFGKDRKKKDYLAEHFPNATITSQQYEPY